MSIKVKITNTFRFDGVDFPYNVELENEQAIQRDKDSLPAAKTGVLAVRTDADTGSITGQSGHGVQTGDVIDIYWTDPTTGLPQRRYGVNAGTVSGTTIPIDGGDGDDLPLVSTALTLMVHEEESFLVAGDDVTCIVCKSNHSGSVTFTLSDDTVVFSAYVEANRAYHWYAGSGVTNPLAGQAIAKVKFTSADSANVSNMSIGLLVA